MFVHELGHFLIAKKSGIRVDEFAIGFPPKIYSWKKGETVYSINLIPFGGFVKIFGENPDEESLAGPDASRSFAKKRRDIQAAVLAGGILFNILFAWILFSGSLMLGVASEGSGPDASLYIVDVAKDSPAKVSGLQAADKIISLSDSAGKTVAAPLTPDAVHDFIVASNGSPVTVNISRGGKEMTEKVTPVKGVVGNDYGVGITMLEISIRKLGFFPAIWEGGKDTVNAVESTAASLWSFIKSAFVAKANLGDISGPVGIVSLVSQAREFGFGYLLSFTALISVNLAVINLIPFPALDGGRLLFVAIEAIRRKAVSPKILNTLNVIGFVILMVLMVVLTISDISKLIGK